MTFSPVGWLDYRHELGRAGERERLLGFLHYATGYEPIPYSVPAHLAWSGDTSLRTHKLMLGGYGAGKSHWGMAELVMAVIANPGCRFLVATPTYDQVSGVLRPHWERYIGAMQRRGFPLQRRFYEAHSVASLHCGGKVYFRSYSKVGNLLGFEFAAALLDEIDTIPASRMVWDTISSRVRQPDANWLQVFGTTTPNGLSGAVEAFHQARQDPEQRRRWYWDRIIGVRCEQSAGNPHLSPDYYDSMRASMSTRRWKQEVMAEILRPASAVLPEYDPARHGLPYRWDPGLPYDLAIDWGDQWPAVLWIQRTPAGDVIAEEMVDDVGSDQVRAYLLETIKALGRWPEMLVGDRAVKSEMAWAVNTFRPHGTQVVRMRTRREQSVAEGLEILRALFDPYEGRPRLYISEKLTRNPPRRGISKSLQNYRYRQAADGRILADPWKDNVHDHQVDALRMWAMARYGSTSSVESVAAPWGGDAGGWSGRRRPRI